MNREQTISPGIVRRLYTYQVRWYEAGRTRTKQFPLDTPLETLKAFRATKKRLAGQRTALDRGGSFGRDVVRFLRLKRGLASYGSDRAHLRAWVQRFRTRPRSTITREQIQQAIRDWQMAGYAPRTLRHRRRVLREFFTALDPDQPNPTLTVKLPKMPRSRPRSVSDALVREVAERLRRSEICRTLRDAKTRARYLVLATTGQRPAQLQRAKPADVDFERRIWFVDPAKGDAGTVLYLNDEMHAAWTLFAQAKAWGAFNQRSFVKTLQRNGWPKGIRPYNLRHTVGLALSELGVDLGDIQAHMGHTSPTTTRIYVPGVLERLKDASERLNGRLGFRVGVQSEGERGAKAVHLPPFFSTVPQKEKGRSRKRKLAKTA